MNSNTSQTLQTLSHSSNVWRKRRTNFVTNCFLFDVFHSIFFFRNFLQIVLSRSHRSAAPSQLDLNWQSVISWVNSISVFAILLDIQDVRFGFEEETENFYAWPNSHYERNNQINNQMRFEIWFLSKERENKFLRVNVANNCFFTHVRLLRGMLLTCLIILRV